MVKWLKKLFLQHLRKFLNLSLTHFNKCLRNSNDWYEDKTEQRKSIIIHANEKKRLNNELSCCFTQQSLIIDELFYERMLNSMDIFFLKIQTCKWSFICKNKTKHIYAFLCVDFQEFFFILSAWTVKQSKQWTQQSDFSQLWINSTLN